MWQTQTVGAGGRFGGGRGELWAHWLSSRCAPCNPPLPPTSPLPSSKMALPSDLAVCVAPSLPFSPWRLARDSVWMWHLQTGDSGNLRPLRSSQINQSPVSQSAPKIGFRLPNSRIRSPPTNPTLSPIAVPTHQITALYAQHLRRWISQKSSKTTASLAQSLSLLQAKLLLLKRA